jgi:hypothetical protein
MDHPPAYEKGPADPTPEERLSLLNDDEWEQFIERCARQLLKEGIYVNVQRLGGAGDKGRDICGYLTAVGAAADKWDLYQGKHYQGSLGPAQFGPDLVKFLHQVFTGGYTRPRFYYVCALNLGTKLFDLIRDPARFRKWLLENWPEEPSTKLTGEFRKFIAAFPFEIFRVKNPADLLDIHGRDAPSHWKHFGTLGNRGPNPPAPPVPGADELKYVEALLKVYTEQKGAPIADSTTVPAEFAPHFSIQRRLFFSAEGLNRFSRDKLPGAFAELLDQVELGVGTALSTKYSNGMNKLGAVLNQASGLQVSDNPLSARLQAGDLQGSCHHLANQDRATWVDEGKEE